MPLKRATYRVIGVLSATVALRQRSLDGREHLSDTLPASVFSAGVETPVQVIVVGGEV
jgi:hypothetical protein